MTQKEKTYGGITILLSQTLHFCIIEIGWNIFFIRQFTFQILIKNKDQAKENERTINFEGSWWLWKVLKSRIDQSAFFIFLKVINWKISEKWTLSQLV